ncbi:arylesterase [Elioraea tepida]|uniref:Arylesterase n=2 Tax=Elioraea tepida TaxID=2843330 RepID=A0A975U6I9_9PROT|nr:arylesterase [Elioraea tepida]
MRAQPLQLLPRYGPALSRRKLASLAGVALLTAMSARARAQGGREIRILALGDSLTAGYGLPRQEGFAAQLQAALRAKGIAATVIDAGVSGDTTAGGRARLDWALADRPDAAIVALGGNDLLRAIPPEATYANLDAILRRLAERNIPVLLAGMLAPRNLGQDYVTAFEGAYQRLAREHDVVFYPFFLDGVATVPELNQPDGIHPNARGVAVMVERILPAVERLLARVRA